MQSQPPVPVACGDGTSSTDGSTDPAQGHEIRQLPSQTARRSLAPSSRRSGVMRIFTGNSNSTGSPVRLSLLREPPQGMAFGLADNAGLAWRGFGFH